MSEQPAGELFGRYRATRRLGGGAMGEVLAGVDTVTGETVAIKVLHRTLSGDPSFRSRFEQEAHIATLLHSPFTVRLHGFGISGDRPYLVMDFVDGPTAADVIQQRGTMATAAALGVALDVARALEESDR